MTWIVLLAGALALACAGTPGPPVPVRATPQELATLAGEWSGEYENTETGRSGSIVFRLAAGSDTAHGDVVMTPGVVVQQGLAAEQGVSRAPSGPVMSISFVTADHGRVTGVLDPYRDPSCDCMAVTTFSGTRRNDRITGEFRTRTERSARYSTGTWSVTRVR